MSEKEPGVGTQMLAEGLRILACGRLFDRTEYTYIISFFFSHIIKEQIKITTQEPTY